MALSKKWVIYVSPGVYTLQMDGKEKEWILTQIVYLARSWGQDEDEAFYRILKFFERKDTRKWHELLQLRYQDAIGVVHCKKLPRKLRGQCDRIPMLLLS